MSDDPITLETDDELALWVATRVQACSLATPAKRADEAVRDLRKRTPKALASAGSGIRLMRPDLDVDFIVTPAGGDGEAPGHFAPEPVANSRAGSHYADGSFIPRERQPEDAHARAAENEELWSALERLERAQADWSRVCAALHLVDSANVDAVVSTIADRAQREYDVRSAICRVTNENGGESDPGRVSLVDAWELFEDDVLGDLLEAAAEAKRLESLRDCAVSGRQETMRQLQEMRGRAEAAEAELADMRNTLEHTRERLRAELGEDEDRALTYHQAWGEAKELAGYDKAAWNRKQSAGEAIAAWSLDEWLSFVYDYPTVGERYMIKVDGEWHEAVCTGPTAPDGLWGFRTDEGWDVGTRAWAPLPDPADQPADDDQPPES